MRTLIRSVFLFYLVVAIGCSGGGSSSKKGGGGCPAITISTSSLPGGTVGAGYSSCLTASGGTMPFTWTVSAGLPAGLSLDPAGCITGTPTPPGIWNFVVTVTDSCSTPGPMSNAKALSITITGPACTPPNITTAILPNGEEGTAYNECLMISGGTPTFMWSVSSGTLPAGLTLNSSSGCITGTPALGSAGPHSFVVQVTDSCSPVALSDIRALSLTIDPGVPSSFGFVTIDGTDIDFAGADHNYDPVFDESDIVLYLSTPPGWTIFIVWSGDSPVPLTDTILGDPWVQINDPFGDIYYADALVIDPTVFVDLEVGDTLFATVPGDQTDGFFYGTVENAVSPFDVLTLTNGDFEAERQ